jgi:hypothetical protein
MVLDTASGFRAVPAAIYLDSDLHVQVPEDWLGDRKLLQNGEEQLRRSSETDGLVLDL